MSWLATNCPRLARARDQHNAHVRQQAVDRRRHAELLCRAEQLLAHRELQLIRAEATGDAKYIRKRHGKLVAARAAVESIRRAAV